MKAISSTCSATSRRCAFSRLYSRGRFTSLSLFLFLQTPFPLFSSLSHHPILSLGCFILLRERKRERLAGQKETRPAVLVQAQILLLLLLLLLLRSNDIQPSSLRSPPLSKFDIPPSKFPPSFKGLSAGIFDVSKERSRRSSILVSILNDRFPNR